MVLSAAFYFSEVSNSLGLCKLLKKKKKKTYSSSLVITNSLKKYDFFFQSDFKMFFFSISSPDSIIVLAQIWGQSGPALVVV